MIQLNTSEFTYNKTSKQVVWLLALLAIVSPIFSSISEQIIQPHNTKSPVVIVYFDTKDLDNYRQNFRYYRPEKFQSVWSDKVREIDSSWQNFLSVYDKVPLELNKDSIGLYFFSKDGVYLWHTKISNIKSSHNLPDWETIKTFDKWNKEYENFKKTNKTKRSLLFWPLRAYESNLYRLSRVWLAKVKTSRLTQKEKKGYEQLKRLLSNI
ncbi:MAG: hypothetical protein ABUK01_02360 [Leptospirales bacterium]